MKILQIQYKIFSYNADIISAESNFSSENLTKILKRAIFISQNGSDDEINYIATLNKISPINIVVSVGTYKYKDISSAFEIFKFLNSSQNLRWVIIGSSSEVPKAILRSKNILVRENLKRSHVIRYLKYAKYYLSATKIENSFNAAAEGVFHSSISILSPIEPHRELVGSSSFTLLNDTKFSNFLVVNRSKINPKVLKSWEVVINEMLDFASSIRDGVK